MSSRNDNEGHATDARTGPSTVEPDHLWDLHGPSVWLVACALLGDQSAALRAVALGMVDLFLPSNGPVGRGGRHGLRDAAGFVYWRCEEAMAGSPVARTMTLPSVMVHLGELAELQRACIALCAFGGHTYTEAADVLSVPPGTVAALLTSGLRELAHMAADGGPGPVPR